MAHPVKMRDQLAMVAEIFLIFFPQCFGLGNSSQFKNLNAHSKEGNVCREPSMPILDSNTQAMGYLY